MHWYGHWAYFCVRFQTDVEGFLRRRYSRYNLFSWSICNFLNLTQEGQSVQSQHWLYRTITLSSPPVTTLVTFSCSTCLIPKYLPAQYLPLLLQQSPLAEKKVISKDLVSSVLDLWQGG